MLRWIFPHKSLKKEGKAQLSAKNIVAYEQSQFYFNVVTQKTGDIKKIE